MIEIIRVSDQSHRRAYEYENGEIDIEKDKIIEDFGRCEFGEIIYCKENGVLKLELHYNSNTREYYNYTANINELGE